MSGAPYTKADNGPEIEVTREMAKAGLRALWRHDEAFYSDEERIAAVYRAMVKSKASPGPGGPQPDRGNS